ncbi:hypothetical protein FGO68_gene4365 [Halteria grandinella]|uniref:Uncharacterized protein n=1 Tax=Halteria grandinella TaxID=5974 RepID=A0A8J8NIS4_HALGN|nr:hypothetical protein FGO68_gene4365 [Halteria grandinella]
MYVFILYHKMNQQTMALLCILLFMSLTFAQTSDQCNQCLTPASVQECYLGISQLIECLQVENNDTPFHESVYIEYSDLDQLEIKSINAQNNPLKAPPPRHSLFYIYHELDKDLKVELQCKVGSRANVSAKVGQVIGGNMSQIDYGCGYALTLIKNKTAVIDLDLSQDGEDDFVIIRISPTGLSLGAIYGLIFSILPFLAALCVLIFRFIKKRRQDNYEEVAQDH